MLAFLGIIKLLASLEGAEKHEGKKCPHSANCSQFLLSQKLVKPSGPQRPDGFHTGALWTPTALQQKQQQANNEGRWARAAAGDVEINISRLAGGAAWILVP